MTIEGIVFQRKRWNPEAMRRFGFCEENGRMVYRTDFYEDAFTAVIAVGDDGSMKGTVIDRMNGEEYLQLRMERFDGAYVHSVRNAYQTLLEQIAEACCTDVLFASDQANRITEQIRLRYGVVPDFPWGQSPHDRSGVFRHADTQKWFALIMHVPLKSVMKNRDSTAVDVINLKIDPNEADALHKSDVVFPAYHMNHRQWITVLLNDTLPDAAVAALIDDSYRLTQKKSTNRSRKETV